MIRVIKKQNIESIKRKSSVKPKTTSERIVKGWIIEQQDNKQKQELEARKFWGLI